MEIKQMDASREGYENGGWADGRLGQIYDKLDEVLQEQHPEHESHEMLKRLMVAVEEADMEIASIEIASHR